MKRLFFWITIGLAVIGAALVTTQPVLHTTNSIYRTPKATVAEAQSIDRRIGQRVVPDNLVLENGGIYRGIVIKWEAKQPIVGNRMTWLKAAMDKLPPFFIKDHPVTGIYSVSSNNIKLRADITAFADGLKIILASDFFSDRFEPPFVIPVDKGRVEHTLFHEWMHVVQYYEALQTFSDSYLLKRGAGFPKVLTPFMEDFGKSAGWVFKFSEADDKWTAELKKDKESQKTSPYGTVDVSEDMADTAVLFMTCSPDSISSARIAWMEKITSTKAADYCK